MSLYTRRGWTITTDTLCGTYVDLTTDDDGRADVLLHPSQSDAQDDLADCLASMREAVESGDLSDYDEDGAGVAYVGVDKRGRVYELDPLTGDTLRPLYRGDMPR